jgi:hypothetical protein
MLVVIVADDFPDIVFFVFIYPSGAFPKANFAIGWSAADALSWIGSFHLFIIVCFQRYT